MQVLVLYLHPCIGAHVQSRTEDKRRSEEEPGDESSHAHIVRLADGRIEGKTAELPGVGSADSVKMPR